MSLLLEANSTAPFSSLPEQATMQVLDSLHHAGLLIGEDMYDGWCTACMRPSPGSSVVLFL